MSSDVYVVFEPCVSRWWTKLLHKTISHCYVVFIDGDKCVALNRSLVSIEVFLIDDFSDIINKHRVIAIQPQKVNKRLVSLNTCVSLTKEILGIKSALVITPYQLYKYLR